jgi:predicted CxxxxCH...CXXCH cytochrome family protein
MPSGNGSFFPSPSYDANTLKCSTTYCHGNWRLRKASSPVFNQQYYTDSVMVGGKYSPVWTGGSPEATCTTCHSSVSEGQVSAVPTGHPSREISQCGGCHSGIVDVNGNIVDKAKHINGKVNVFGTERSF